MQRAVRANETVLLSKQCIAYHYLTNAVPNTDEQYLRVSSNFQFSLMHVRH